MFGRLADVGSRRFEPVIDSIDAALLECETRALEGESGAVRQVQPLRRQISVLRGVVRPQRSVLQSAVYGDSALIGERARRRLTDVLERHDRIEGALELARATANGVVELHRSSVAEKTNEIMKVLTVFSATLLPMTLIAGIYGMNFGNIPELDYRFGYPLTLAVMAGVGLVLWRYFVRRGFVAGKPLSDLATRTSASVLEAARLPVTAVGSLIVGSLRGHPLHPLQHRSSPPSQTDRHGDAYPEADSPESSN